MIAMFLLAFVIIFPVGLVALLLPGAERRAMR